MEQRAPKVNAAGMGRNHAFTVNTYRLTGGAPPQSASNGGDGEGGAGEGRAPPTLAGEKEVSEMGCGAEHHPATPHPIQFLSRIDLMHDARLCASPLNSANAEKVLRTPFLGAESIN